MDTPCKLYLLFLGTSKIHSMLIIAQPPLRALGDAGDLTEVHPLLQYTRTLKGWQTCIRLTRDGTIESTAGCPCQLT